MKNINEINNNEIINEVNSIMNTVSEEKLNEIRKKWEIFYEMSSDFSDMIKIGFDEITKDGYDINYILDDYDDKFESELLIYESVYVDSCDDTMYIMFDKNNKFYLVNRDEKTVYFIK